MAVLKTEKLGAVAVLVVAAAFFLYDIISDVLGGHEHVLHVTLEAAMFVATILVLGAEIRRVGLLRSEVVEEQARNARLSGELLKIMRQQFADWGLSAAESEVALLLIKGLSMKEISAARGVAERTVRQQATAIYAKSAYAGRHELAAHFIEDLMQ